MSDPRQQFAFLRVELVVGEDAGVAQVAELLQERHDVHLGREDDVCRRGAVAGSAAAADVVGELVGAFDRQHVAEPGRLAAGIDDERAAAPAVLCRDDGDLREQEGLAWRAPSREASAYRQRCPKRRLYETLRTVRRCAAPANEGGSVGPIGNRSEYRTCNQSPMLVVRAIGVDTQREEQV